MNADPNRWYVVPEVWLMLFMLIATMTGSISLVVTAFEHRDELKRSAPALAAPLPPSSAARPADSGP